LCASLLAEVCHAAELVPTLSSSAKTSLFPVGRFVEVITTQAGMKKSIFLSLIRQLHGVGKLKYS
jgi:hypothetical protein